jgi:hypothetical protein
VDFVSVLRAHWDRFGAVGCSIVGGLFLLFGWLGVSNTPYLVEQIPYVISGGIGGVFFLGVGATMWLSADLRDEWAKLDRIEEALRDGSLRWVESDGWARDSGSVPPVKGSAPAGHESWASQPADATTENPIVVAEVRASAARVRKPRPTGGTEPSVPSARTQVKGTAARKPRAPRAATVSPARVTEGRSR